MRIATYNVEWFANLFDTHNHLLADGGWSGRQDVTRADQIAALGIVFTALDADAVMVIEAPNHGHRQDTVVALERFAAHFDLRQRRALIGFANETQQEIALLYDPDILQATHDPGGSDAAPQFDSTFRIDLDVDATEDLVTFSKPPLEVAMTTARGTRLRLIGAHLKSKAPHGARNADAVMRLSIANRRKQLAQAIWLRARMAEVLAAGTPLVVLGDLNDGPGLDEYEQLFRKSSVEILLGEEMYDPHARVALQRRIGAMPTTARFRLAAEDRYLQALLDYVMVSPDLMHLKPEWRIWHPFDDAHCWRVPELRDALLSASDHFPVSVDIDI